MKKVDISERLSSYLRQSEVDHELSFLHDESDIWRNLSERLDQLIAELYHAVSTPIASITEESDYQLSVGASFIKSHFVIRPLICLLRRICG